MVTSLLLLVHLLLLLPLTSSNPTNITFHTDTTTNITDYTDLANFDTATTNLTRTPSPITCRPTSPSTLSHLPNHGHNPNQILTIALSALTIMRSWPDYNKTLRWQSYHSSGSFQPLATTRYLPIDFTEPQTGRGQVAIYYDGDMTDKVTDYFRLKAMEPLAVRIVERCLVQAVVGGGAGWGQEGVVRNDGGWAYLDEKRREVKMQVVWGERWRDLKEEEGGAGRDGDGEVMPF